jgi:hypothetical protein
MYPSGDGYGYKYVQLEKVIDKAKEIMPRHGLAAIQFPFSTDPDEMGVVTRVIHTSGEWIEETAIARPTNMKGVNQTQAAGATITYLRRYGLLAVLGATGDKDTDGKADNDTSQTTDFASSAKYELHAKRLRKCLTVDDLYEAFKTAWNALEGDTEGRKYITQVKDELKETL